MAKRIKEMKIVSLKLVNLRNATHATFMRSVRIAIEETAPKEVQQTDVVAAFLKAQDEEGKLTKSFRLQLTIDMRKAHDKRVRLLRVFRDRVKVELLACTDEKHKAAERLWYAFEHFGGTSMVEHGIVIATAGIRMLVDTLDNKLQEAVELLGLEECVKNLRQANHDFYECDINRTCYVAERGDLAIEKARAKTDRYYRAMIRALNIDLMLGKENLLPLARLLLVLVNQYRPIVHQPTVWPAYDATIGDELKSNEESNDPTRENNI